MIECPVEISFIKGWINKKQLNQLAIVYKNNSYGNYVKNLIE